MARWSDFPEWDQRRHLDRIRTLPEFGPPPIVPGPPVAERRVAIVTTAGLHERGARPFEVGSADYRVIRAHTPPGDVVMSHISVNYDRTGFQEDVNVVFPLARLRELHEEGVVGAISRSHYSFMGASPIMALEPKARELAGLMKADGVDAALLVPV
jgi:D-proline reductase (dithiol) PrdB